MCSTLLHFTHVAFFYKIKARPSTSKQITSCSIAVLRSTAVSPRHACRCFHGQDFHGQLFLPFLSNFISSVTAFHFFCCTLAFFGHFPLSVTHIYSYITIYFRTFLSPEKETLHPLSCNSSIPFH